MIDDWLTKQALEMNKSHFQQTLEQMESGHKEALSEAAKAGEVAYHAAITSTAAKLEEVQKDLEVGLSAGRCGAELMRAG